MDKQYQMHFDNAGVSMELKKKRIGYGYEKAGLLFCLITKGVLGLVVIELGHLQLGQVRHNW